MTTLTSDHETGSRLPGLILSLIVPGLGVARAGKLGRGVAWFLVTTLLWALALALPFVRGIGTASIAAAVTAAGLVTLVMLADCARPGRDRATTWWFLGVGFTLGLLFAVLFLWGCRSFRVVGNSMHPTLQGRDRSGRGGDWVAVERFSCRFGELRRGDLLVFSTDGIRVPAGAGVFVHRLVGLPGERIEIRDGNVWADGRALGSADGLPQVVYLSPQPNPLLPVMLPAGADYQVPADSYFVLGDNSANALDSRYWGHVPRRNLIGRVSRIYWPPSRSGPPT
jgi:signal peptidase I